VRRLAKVTKGMHGKYARQLYYSVALLYAAVVWCTSAPGGQGKKARGMGSAIRKMESVQRKAAIQTTGALRTTPSDLLFAHADMLPLRDQIELLCRRAGLRVATLPKEHPIYTQARRAMRKQVRLHSITTFVSCISAFIFAMGKSLWVVLFNWPLLPPSQPTGFYLLYRRIFAVDTIISELNLRESCSLPSFFVPL
jgi:hypothetical protein